MIGDNLGVNELLGFKQSFANYFVCRMCGATKQVLQDRPIAGHSLHIHTSNNADARDNPEKFGIGRETIFTILNCNLFKLAPPDLFHDILEGILPDIIQLILVGLKVRKGDLMKLIKKIKWVNYAVGIDPNFTVMGKALQVSLLNN